MHANCPSAEQTCDGTFGWSARTKYIYVRATYTNQTFGIYAGTQIFMPFFMVRCRWFVPDNITKISKICSCSFNIYIWCLLYNLLFCCSTRRSTVNAVKTCARHSGLIVCWLQHTAKPFKLPLGFLLQDFGPHCHGCFLQWSFDRVIAENQKHLP